MRQDDNQTILQSMKRVFGEPSTRQLYLMIGELHALPEQIESLILEHADEDHYEISDLLSWRTAVGTALSAAHALGNPTSTMVKHYKSEHIAGLKFCGGVLSSAGIERRTDPEVLDDLYSRTNDLYIEVMQDSQIPSDLRTFICDQLDRIRLALREFTIRGPEALDEALNQIAGAVVRNQRIAADANETSQTFLERLGAILDLGEKIVNTAKTIGEATPAIVTAGGVLLAVLNGEHQPELPPAEPAVIVIDQVPDSVTDGAAVSGGR